MRALSYYIVVLIVLLASPSLAGASDSDLPGIGTFSYNGSPVLSSAPFGVADANVGR